MTAKRVLDVALAGLAALVLLPVALIVAAAIRLESSGPTLLRQPRVGRGGRLFGMWKFRTMVADAEQRRAELWALSHDRYWLALDHDPRVTRVGRFLRHTSLDELPQLLNVLRGDMSLVGPRPLIPAEHDLIPEWARPRDAVTPGMTGLWQVSGRAALGFEEMLRLDCEYVSGWSLRRDLVALARTVPAVLSRRGAN